MNLNKDNINQQDANGLTPFFIICGSNRADKAVLAHQIIDSLGQNMDIRLVDVNKQGMMFWALELRDTAILTKVKQLGVDVNPQDNTGRTCLDWASEYLWADGVKWLVENEAKVNLTDNSNVSPLWKTLIAATTVNEEQKKLDFDVNKEKALLDTFSHFPAKITNTHYTSK